MLRGKLFILLKIHYLNYKKKLYLYYNYVEIKLLYSKSWLKIYLHLGILKTLGVYFKA